MDEIRKVLQLSLGDSPKNVKELKSDIYELKNAIGDMVVAGKTGTTEYDQAVKLLGQDLQTLQQVQNSTKKEVDALDGSYNALVQRMRELKTEWRATNDVARRDELGKKITEINNQLKTLDYGIGNFQRNVGNYGNAWDSLAGTLNTAQSAGSQFTSGMQAMSGVLGLTTTQTESMNESLGVMRGVVGALNSAKGIAGLVKSLASQRAATKAAAAEAKAETATLKAQKVATDQVTVSTGAATVATKLLKAALMSIGIGAIVAAFGVLAANLDKVVGWFTKLGEKMGLVNRQNQDLKKSNDKLTSSIEARNKQLELDVELMQAKGIAQSEILQQQKTTIQANITEAKSEQAKLRAKLDDLDATGKQKNLYKKLNEQYQKNEETLKDLNHQLEVINAKIDTDARQKAEKAAAAAAAAAKARAQKEKTEAEKAAEELAKAREKAEEAVNKVMEKGMTEREKLSKKHTETLAELEKYKAHMTAEVYKKAVEAENKSYAEELAGILSDEYEKAYEKAFEKLENKTKLGALDGAVTKTFREAFGNASFAGEWLDIQRTLDHIQDFYTEVQRASIKELAKFSDSLSDEAKELLPSSLVDPAIYIPVFQEQYKEYLKDSEAYLKKYGEPFTTAVKQMGETYSQFVEDYTDGLLVSMESYERRLDQLKEQGRIEEALSLLDEIREKFSERVGMISEDAAREWRVKWTQFEMSYKATLAESWSGSTAMLVAITRDAFENAIIEIEAELDALLEIEDKTVQDLDKISALRTDLARLRYQQQSAIIDAETKKYREYATSVSGLLGNVASAWDNIIKAQVDAGKINEEQARKSFETMKALQYAVAVISTASAVIQALADPTVPSYILKGINAAAALAAGIAQVAQISATHYGSSGSASTSMPSLVDRSPVTPTVSLNASEAGESMQQNMRVYVVESDITEAQDAARVRVSESTF